jgi:hypothetical protein
MILTEFIYRQCITSKAIVELYSSVKLQTLTKDYFYRIVHYIKICEPQSCQHMQLISLSFQLTASSESHEQRGRSPLQA